MRGPAALRRLGVTVLAVALAGVGVAGLGTADGRDFPSPVPVADCGRGDRPETDVQGRVPASDFESGRAARGYTCNTRAVGHVAGTGGFKVLRHVDASGRECAFYDASQLLPLGLPFQVSGAASGQGVRVLDMSRPSAPVVTTALTTPTMLSPHESLLVNERRGLLAAVMGNAYAMPGVLEIYDIDSDCREPELLSRTTSPTLGHESGWSRDGRTLYVASSGGQTFTAIDLTDPASPVRLLEQYGVNRHHRRTPSPRGRVLQPARGARCRGQRVRRGCGLLPARLGRAPPLGVVLRRDQRLLGRAPHERGPAAAALSPVRGVRLLRPARRPCRAPRASTASRRRRSAPGRSARA